MNLLEDVDTGIISSKSDAKNIAKKEKTKFLVISDSHGSANLMHQVIKFAGKTVDGLIFCGDGITDLFSCLEEAAEDSTFMECIPPFIAFVQGNNDPDSLIDSFREKEKPVHIPSVTTFTASGKKIFLTHGHNYSVYFDTEMLEAEGKERNANAAIFGHTHVPYEMQKSVYCMNPGSIALPRSRAFNSFAILEVAKNYFNTIFYKIVNGSNGMEMIPYFPEPVYY